MPIAELKSVSLNYEIAGKPDGAWLVLLHGATDAFRPAWGRQIEPLGAHFKILGIDMRGHGASNNPANALDLRQMADDIAGLLNHVDGPDTSAHVMGFSGGASVALFFAHRHLARLKKLILVSNNMQRDQARLARGFWNPERMQREQPGWWQHMSRVHQHATPAQLLAWWEAEDRVRPDWTAQTLAGITAPTLVIAGDRDDVVPLEQSMLLYRSLPRAALAVLPGVGHGAPTRNPGLFNKIVQEFLDGQQGGAR